MMMIDDYHATIPIISLSSSSYLGMKLLPEWKQYKHLPFYKTPAIGIMLHVVFELLTTRVEILYIHKILFILSLCNRCLTVKYSVFSLCNRCLAVINSVFLLCNRCLAVIYLHNRNAINGSKA